jgi:hypothetical protein
MVRIDGILHYPTAHWIIFILLSLGLGFFIFRQDTVSGVSTVCIYATVAIFIITLAWLGTIFGAVMLPYYKL